MIDGLIVLTNRLTHFLNQAHTGWRHAFVQFTWFLKIAFVWTSVCECVRSTSDVIWTPYDWVNKLYSFYVATVVSIISGRGLSIDTCHKSQPNKWLYKPLIGYNISSKRWNTSFIKVGMAWHVSKHLKEELTLDTYKQLWIKYAMVLTFSHRFCWFAYLRGWWQW